MKKEECGQVTIFLSLLLISFFLILSVCIEGIYGQMQRADFMEQQLLIGEYAQANYHKELVEQFHLFAIDGRYAAKMEKELKRKLEQNGCSVTKFLITDPVSITAMDGEILKHQIREYMKYKEISDLFQMLKKSLSGVQDDEDVKRMEESIQHVEVKSMEENYENEKDVDIKKEDPRKALLKLLKSDILDLVMPKGSSISERKIAIVYGAEDTKKESKIDFFSKESVLDLIPDSKKESAFNQISTEGLSVLYADLCFRNALDKNAGGGVQYEMEYLISGKSMDRENLKSVVYRLSAIRFVSNYGYLLSNSKCQAEAYALAAAIANVGSAVPGLVEGIKLLILAAWAYGEAIVDVRTLLNGGCIPFVKTETTWQLQLSNLATLTAQEKTKQKGNSYEDYLKILLLLQLDPEEKYGRMLDMIEQRIRESQKGFQLSECLFSYKMTVSQEQEFLFYRMSRQLENSRIYTY